MGRDTQTTEAVGHVYRVAGQTPDGLIFRRCTRTPMSFREFKKPNGFHRLYLVQRQHSAGHRYILSTLGRQLFGFLVPLEANLDRILQAVRARWGAGCELHPAA